MENALVTYGFNKDREGIEKPWICNLRRLAYLFAILHSLLVTIGNFTNILVSQKLFERKLVAHFLLDNSSKGFFSKGFDAEHWWGIYLVAFLTRSVI